MNIGKMMKDLQKMQTQMQQDLQTLEVEGSAGGGIVTARMNGKKELLEIKLAPEAVTPDETDLMEDLLVAAGAPRPVGFRASTFTLTRATWWAFDTLVRRGYRYDSSIHPVRHPTYGIPDFS